MSELVTGMTIGRRMGRLRQRGLSLIEASMVLGVAAVVIAGALLLYNSAHSAQKTAEAIDQMHTIEAGIRQVYGWQTFANLDTATVINARIVPLRMVASSSEMRNTFGGGITVNAIDVNGVTNGGFAVTFSGVPPDSCIVLSTKDYGRQVGQIVVNNTIFDIVSSDTVPKSADVSGPCGVAAATLSWRFYN